MARASAPTLVSAERPTATAATHADWTVAANAAYPGDLVRDVVLYRKLRVRLRKGDALSPAIRRRCLQLEERLLQPPTPSDQAAAGRTFARFPCRFRARLHLSRANEAGLVVEVRDFGVGGAKVENPGVLLDVDELAWLAIDFVGRRGARKIVLTARVVWLGDDDMGLVFAGAPRWARRHGLSQHAARLGDANAAFCAETR